MDSGNTFKKKFRFRISDLRTLSNLSGEEFGELFGVGKTAVHNWEIGRNWPDTDVLIAIANKYNVSLDYLTGRSDFKHSGPQEGGYTLDREEALTVITRDYDEGRRATIANMIKLFDQEIANQEKNSAKDTTQPFEVVREKNPASHHKVK